MRRGFISFFIVLVLTASGQEVIRVGAKHFNEGYILSEMIAQILEANGYTVERKFNLGGTAVSFEALRTGAIDVYPEYTGTITAEILKSTRALSVKQINQITQERYRLEISSPYGFNNTYTFVVKAELAEKLSLRTLSDLLNHPELKIGLSYEFMERRDGWRNLAAFYGFTQNPIALEHGLAYEAMQENKINITDAYSTDGEISKYGLVLLEDDKKFFQEYHAVSFYSSSLPQKAREILDQLSGSVTNDEMQQLNAAALFENKSHREIAHSFLLDKRIITNKNTSQQSDIGMILDKTLEHITLTMLALVGAILVAVPLGVMLYRYPRFTHGVLYATGILQTIPSIALLALMIPILGIGTWPAVVAPFLYALLPILRNTIIGLTTIDPLLKQVASAIGLTPVQSLRFVEFPLALPMVLTGIRMAAVINVGTATLAAFIGAGGLGEFIVTGLALNNPTMIIKGAIPAALLAIGVELVFEAIEWSTIPKHLRGGLL